MKALQNKVAELFESGTISLMIGFRELSDKFIIPCFIEDASKVDRLVWKPGCINNLSTYLHKPEVKKAKKVGIVGNEVTLRSILQLISENQLQDIEKTILAVNENDEVVVLATTEELESYVQAHYTSYSPEDKAMIEKLNAMTREERWKFWTEQFSKCIKCYACRAVCPMCYCSVCTVECNQPQWIKVSSETEGNLEWHIMRAMHIAGRCINCGECTRACPAGIPVHLLSVQMNMEIEKEFGGKTGFSAKGGYALNTFKSDDKEQFIK
jgi:ferredoxin